MNKVVVIGTGLIGGSLCLDIRKHNMAGCILGIESDAGNRRKALEAGIVDDFTDGSAVADAALIIIATPPDATDKLCVQMCDAMGDRAVLMDVCSVKQPVCRAVDGHPKRGHFVSTHPLAGTENSGPEAAQTGLFKGKKVIITEAEKSTPESLELVRSFYNKIGMSCIEMDSVSHDRLLAKASHLAHLCSFVFATTVCRDHEDLEALGILAGSGFASAARLAKSSADMWGPIFKYNKDNMIKEAEAFYRIWGKWLNKLESGDENALKKMIEESGTVRKALKKEDRMEETINH